MKERIENMEKSKLDELSKLNYMTLEEEERETHIYINYLSKGKCLLETTDRFMMQKIEKLMKKDNSKWELEGIQTAIVEKQDGTKERQIVGKVYSAPIECILLRSGKREVSEEKKIQARKRMIELHEQGVL